jgi:hypothetical protein
MKLILRNQIVKSAQVGEASGKATSKAVTTFTLAAVVTGLNWYLQNVICDNDNKRQKELIQRVESEEEATDFLHQFDYHHANDW